jgi:hypothetical protein
LQQSFITWAAVKHPQLGGQDVDAVQEAVWQLAAEDPPEYTALVRAAAAELRPPDEPLPPPYSLLLPPKLKAELSRGATAASANNDAAQMHQQHHAQQPQQDGKGGGIGKFQGSQVNSNFQGDLLWGPEEEDLAERKQQEAEDVREGRFPPGR